MKTFFLVLSIFLISGCEVIAPNVSKAFTEKQQLESFQEQNRYLRDISESLRTISRGMHP